jgi:serine kinase of HPr protein (carbohydrate metabolism regulator)
VTASSQPTHATVVARRCEVEAGWRAAILTGPPGSGKSDLALRLLARGWRLVSDDYVYLFASGGALFARAPDAIEGRMEIRGHGVASIRSLRLARVNLTVELVKGEVERLPEAAVRLHCGIPTPLLRLDPREASACEKVAAASLRL